jgi:NADH-quinone oxidoreductase subunit C
VTPEELVERLGPRFDDISLAHGEVTVVTTRERLVEQLVALKGDPELGFDFLADVSGTDWPDRDLRFWVAYHLYSIEGKHRLRLKVGVPENDAHVPTITEVFPGADFLEREVYDMLGVEFDGHPDMRRILLPEDWDGHPHRKDEELGGVRTQYKGGAFIPPIDQRLHK